MADPAKFDRFDRFHDRFNDRFNERFGRGRGGGFSRQEAIRRLKESVNTGHHTGLPDKLLVLFAPRAALDFKKPPQKKAPACPYTGLANYVQEFAKPGDPEYEPPPSEDRPPSPRLYRNRELSVQGRIETESFLERKLRIVRWKQEEAERKVEGKAREYDPNTDPNIEGDPYKTIFIARLSYDVTEKTLRKEFEEYGPIKRIRMIHDQNTGKPRGYAFIEFEHKKDMKDAYKQADGKKIEGRRVLVEVERGRTVENWRPRRLAGGLGGQSREAKEPKKKKGGLPPAALVEDPYPPSRPPLDRPDRREVRDDRGPDRERGRFDRGPPDRNERPDRERFADRERFDRERFDRDRRDREPKRPRDMSPPRRDRDGGDMKRGRYDEDGEIRDHRRDRRRDRDMM